MFEKNTRRLLGPSRLVKVEPVRRLFPSPSSAKLHEKRYSILDSAPFQVAMTATIYSLPTETKTRIAELCQLQDERFKEVFDALNTRRRAIRPSRVPARLQTTTSSPA